MTFRFPQKLPRKWRLFNRALLIIACLLGVMQCSRCVFESGDVELDDEKTLKREDSLPQRVVPDSAIPERIEKQTSRALNLDHVYAQKDTGLARLMDTYLRRYHPDNALYLAVDAKTNEIIAWGERKDSIIRAEPDFLSRATFPAASLAKTVTVAAAFESNVYSSHSTVPLIGRAHTLYKRQLSVPENYRGPEVSVEDAYAKSFNPPVALIGMRVGAKSLERAAEKFGFNRTFPQGLPERGLYIPPDSGYGLAEVACGFTENTTLSPLQAAAMVRSIVTQKPLEIPWERNGASGYAPSKPFSLGLEPFSAGVYWGLQNAMVATAKKGTSRRYMTTRYISRKVFDDLKIGGKTGSLDGQNPKGRYDWFMGFAQSRSNPDKTLVLVIMQIHGEMRTQVASQVAALLINYWAKENFHD